MRRFFAPSRFLRERFVREWGLPREQIEHLPFGVEPHPGVRVARAPGERLRVRFLGSLIPAKGPDLLLEAWGKLDVHLRQEAELVLFGPARGEERFQSALEHSARSVGATLGGALDRAGVERELARTDLLVVPSRWWENSPLVIHEALAAGVPLLVAGSGGMAELVVPDQHGWHFRLGDGADLARVLGQIIADPARLERLSPPPAAMWTFDQHVAALEQRYRDALDARG